MVRFLVYYTHTKSRIRRMQLNIKDAELKKILLSKNYITEDDLANYVDSKGALA